MGGCILGKVAPTVQWRFPAGGTRGPFSRAGGELKPKAGRDLPPGPPTGPPWAVLTALLAYMALVAALSHTTRPPLPAALLRIPDKILHAIEYVPLGFLWSRLFRGSPVRRLALGWAAACAFGLTDELHQAFVPGRHAGPGDWLADAAGGLLGAAVGSHPGREVRRQDLSAPPSRSNPDDG